MTAVTEQVAREVRAAAGWLRREKKDNRSLDTIFLGGGTPSLFPLPAIGKLFAAIGEEFSLASDVEITMEANPETVGESFGDELLRLTPVNRISLGAQSFSETNLEILERLARPESVEAAVARLRAAGFENLSLDLIFGIPGQTIADTLSDIDHAARLGPDHVSSYNLTLKPGHKLYSQLPSDDEAADLYEACVERLSQLGYPQYEISNYARPGRESRHNLLYWDGGDFLGVGPSASSRFFWDGTFHHRKQLADLDRYLKEDPFPGPSFEAVTPRQAVLEAVFLELRKNKGVLLSEFRRRYDYDISSARNFVLFTREGLLKLEGEVLRLTARGRLLADRVTRDLVD